MGRGDRSIPWEFKTEAVHMKRVLLSMTAIALVAVATQAANAADMPARKALPAQAV